MAGYTDYLNLYFKNPSTDGADTFNIQTMMNDNWEKIDEFASMAGLPDAGKGIVYVKCVDAAGDPVLGCVVQAGDVYAVTSALGHAKLHLTAGSYSAVVRAPIDYGLGEQTVAVTVRDGKISSYTVTVSDASGGATQKTITTSCVCAFSARVSSADVFGVGGGGSGGAACSGGSIASGGAGGKTETKQGINVDCLFFVSVGAGGAAVSGNSEFVLNGNDGGDTIVIGDGETNILATGGEGGKASKGNGGVSGANGGSGSGGAYVLFSTSLVGNSGSNGSDGEPAHNQSGGTGQGSTTCSFGEENSNENYSSAGGGAVANSKKLVVGSAGTGAGTGAAKSGEDAEAGSATTPGSGGGAAAAYNGGKATSGAGADGLVIFRWEVAS